LKETKLVAKQLAKRFIIVMYHSL